MNGITFEGERITTMSEKKKGKKESCNNVVVVAIKAASRDISKHALVWALTHVVHQPSDSITLLLLLPSHASGRRLWGFPRFSGDCANAHRRGHTGSGLEQKSDVAELCSQMMGQLRNVYEQNRVNIKVKIVPGSPCGAVAAESKRVNANWVVLDKHLRNEEKRCMEELQCNIVVMKRNQPKVVRLNLVGATEAEAQLSCVLTCALDESSGKVIYDNRESHRDSSSPEVETQFTTTTTTTTEAGTSSGSSSDPGTSPFSVTEKEEQITIKEKRNSDAATSDSDSESSIAPTSMEFQPWVADILSARLKDSAHVSSSSKALKDKFLKLDRSDMEFSRNVRDTVSLSRNAPPGPPPLCSICQHEAPMFGKPPRWFSYAELEMATGGFSKANFLAEGGFGSVHRGVLPDGQAVAVKQHKPASSQGDHEFCSEVEVLSCAQHRNVVMLIGFCVEDRRRLLVYEYICNGSLDSHLYGRKRELLEWSARQKIAVGAARGLRYLHEECRVGCIVHRDMRPNNILITHDFEPLVGDFGLARWQPDGDLGVETRVIGTFGYLAPEYAESGQITEKADVYSFGVVLVELVTGRKAVDINRPKGQQCLTEWARPLLEDFVISDLIDPRLGNSFSEQEVYCMLHAASLCIRRDPHARPKMSQVLRILEGDMLLESNYLPTPSHDPGSVSGHHSGPIKREAFGVFGGNHSCDSLRAALEKERGTKAGVCRIRGR